MEDTLAKWLLQCWEEFIRRSGCFSRGFLKNMRQLEWELRRYSF